MSLQEHVYEMLVDSLANTLYEEIKHVNFATPFYQEGCYMYMLAFVRYRCTCF